jgi:hypothetical protein
MMLITKPERLRSRPHLAYVGSLPCCIPDCEEGPVQVHHLTHVQPKARGLKASDVFTVPLCLRHHLGQGGVHTYGREGAWWAAHGVDPVKLAARLWAESPKPQRDRSPA